MRFTLLPVFLIGVTLSGHMNMEKAGVQTTVHPVRAGESAIHQEQLLTSAITRYGSLIACHPSRVHCRQNP